MIAPISNEIKVRNCYISLVWCLNRLVFKLHFVFFFSIINYSCSTCEREMWKSYQEKVLLRFFHLSRSESKTRQRENQFSRLKIQSALQVHKSPARPLRGGQETCAPMATASSCQCHVAVLYGGGIHVSTVTTVSVAVRRPCASYIGRLFKDQVLELVTVRKIKRRDVFFTYNKYKNCLFPVYKYWYNVAISSLNK